jgi:hypothetical protein
VEVRPPDPTPAAGVTPASVEIPQGTPVYIGGNDNAGDDIYEARRKRELRDRAIGGQGRPEQLPAVKPTPRPAPVRLIGSQVLSTALRLWADELKP